MSSAALPSASSGGGASGRMGTHVVSASSPGQVQAGLRSTSPLRTSPMQQQSIPSSDGNQH